MYGIVWLFTIRCNLRSDFRIAGKVFVQSFSGGTWVRLEFLHIYIIWRCELVWWNDVFSHFVTGCFWWVHNGPHGVLIFRRMGFITDYPTGQVPGESELVSPPCRERIRGPQGSWPRFRRLGWWFNSVWKWLIYKQTSLLQLDLVICVFVLIVVCVLQKIQLGPNNFEKFSIPKTYVSWRNWSRIFLP